MSTRIGSTTPIRHRPVAAALVAVLAVAVLAPAACSSADDEPATAPASTGSTTATSVRPSTTAVTSTTTTTVPAGPPLSERLALVEVSVRLDEPAAPEQILSISVDDDTLAAVVDEGVDATPAWCSGVVEPDATTFVVRLGPPAVSDATGGIERFELVADDLAVGSPSSATFTVVVDGTTIVADGEVRVLDDAARSGAFSGAAPDGTTVEGAFRCA